MWIRHIPSNIRTNASGSTAAPRNQNSSSPTASSPIGQSGLWSAYRPTMFTNHENSKNEFHLSILEALVITEHRLKLCIQKQFYTSLFFNNPIGPREEENTITRTNSSGSWSLFWLSFLPPPLQVFRQTKSQLCFLRYKLYCQGHNYLKRNDQNKGSILGF